MGRLNQPATPVQAHGHLITHGGTITNERGAAYILRGMSLFWSQWMPQFYNPHVVDWLVRDWKINAVRAAMGVHQGGYLENPEAEYDKVTAVVDAAVRAGIYVIVDWHAHEREEAAACDFFERLSSQYRNTPNLIYEIWNEPQSEYSWDGDIKPYHEAVIAKIRKQCPKSLIVVGTENYSQRVDRAAEAPLLAHNIAYTLHFYAASHRSTLRQRAMTAASSGLALLVTEYGTCEATGDGQFAPGQMKTWWEFMEHLRIGHLNWAISDKAETASALRSSASPLGEWNDAMLTPSGRLVRAYLRSHAPGEDDNELPPGAMTIGAK